MNAMLSTGVAYFHNHTIQDALHRPLQNALQYYEVARDKGQFLIRKVVESMTPPSHPNTKGSVLGTSLPRIKDDIQV